jgi:hypothetical protein
VLSQLIAYLVLLWGCLVPSHTLAWQNVASDKSVVATKSVAKKLKAKLWQEN